MFSSKAIAIRDEEVITFSHKHGLMMGAIHSPAHFVDRHREWLTYGNNTFYIEGLERYTGFVTAGCTEAFNEVYTEPCYVLHGEYTYHRDAGRATETKYKNIPAGSRLIISYPFAATGNPHKEWDSILRFCEDNKIKVFVDACLAGVSIGRLDCRRNCITHVSFSFSKAFDTGFFRCGVVYTKQHTAGPASVLNKHMYVNHPTLGLHLKLMENFASDFITKKYRMKQIEICQEHDMEQSDCILFGLIDDERRCISPVLGTLPPFHQLPFLQ
tara:strand:+ start:3529 stop:4341 length:813 start_codon:yes stop_codon:yes gene_type:complete